MNNKKTQNIIIVLIVLLIIAIVGCTIVLVKTIKTDNPKENETTQKEKSTPTPTPIVTPTPTPSVSLNEFGTSLTTNLTYMTIQNCLNGNSCDEHCNNTKIIRIDDTAIIQEIVSQIQTGTQVASLPQDGSVMEFCGGIYLTFYYQDGTYSAIWFASRNYLVHNKKAPTSGGNWQAIEYYHYDTQDLYNYLVQKHDALK